MLLVRFMRLRNCLYILNFYCNYVVTMDFFFFSIIFFFVFIFLNDGILESSDILRLRDNPVKVVFRFYFTYNASSVRNLTKGGSLVDDLEFPSF